jgi:hypothetical protein
MAPGELTGRRRIASRADSFFTRSMLVPSQSPRGRLESPVFRFREPADARTDVGREVDLSPTVIADRGPQELDHPFPKRRLSRAGANVVARNGFRLCAASSYCGPLQVQAIPISKRCPCFVGALAKLQQ